MDHCDPREGLTHLQAMVLPQLPPDHRLEIVAAMTPWLARETDGELPAALAGLRIEASGRSENDQWMIARVLGKVEGEP